MKHVYDDSYTRVRTRVLTIIWCLGAAVLVLVIFEFQRPDYQERSPLAIIILVVPCVALSARACFIGTVLVSTELCCYRGLFRNYVRPWTQIDHFEFVRRGNPGAESIEFVSLVMVCRVDPGTQHADRWGTLRWPGDHPNAEARRVAGWLNGYVERHGRRPST